MNNEIELKLLFSDELKTIAKVNLNEEDINNQDKTKNLKFVLKNNKLSEDELQKKYAFAKASWKKIAKYLLIFRFVNKETIFLGFNSDEDNKKITYQTFVILPNHTLKIIFDVIKSYIILYNLIIVPFRFFFFLEETELFFIPIDMAFDLFNLFDIIINFFVAYYDKGKTIRSFELIALKYLKSQFIIDVLSIIPYYFISDIFYAFRFFRFFQFFVFLKFQEDYISWILGLLTSNFNFIKSFAKLMEFVFELIVTSQFLCCVWYYLGNNKDGWVPLILYPQSESGLDYSFCDPNEPPCVNGWRLELSTTYISSIYWVLSTLTTLGYGDIYGHTISELLFTMLVQFFGIFVFAYLMGNINDLIQKLDDNTLEYKLTEERNLDEWLIRLEKYNPHKIKESIFLSHLKRTFLDYWSRDHTCIKNKKIRFFDQLPFDIKYQLIDIIFGGFIQDLQLFFMGLEIEFTIEVLVNLVPKKFANKTEIIKKGENTDFVYFIVKGEVAISSTDGILKYVNLPKFSYFGDHLILLNLLSSNYYIAHRGEVVCMCLPKKKFQKLCSVFPHSQQILKEKALKRRARFNEGRTNIKNIEKGSLQRRVSISKSRSSSVKNENKSLIEEFDLSKNLINLMPIEKDEINDEISELDIITEQNSPRKSILKENPGEIKSLIDRKKINSTKEFKNNTIIFKDEYDEELFIKTIKDDLSTINENLNKLNNDFNNMKKTYKNRSQILDQEMESLKKLAYKLRFK